MEVHAIPGKRWYDIELHKIIHLKGQNQFKRRRLAILCSLDVFKDVIGSHFKHNERMACGFLIKKRNLHQELQFWYQEMNLTYYLNWILLQRSF
jgi:hypothetical protein